MTPRLVRLAVAAVVLAAGLVAAPPARATVPTPVLSKTIIGHSVLGRPIIAYHLGNPRLKTSSVLIGQMHGDEHAGVIVADSIIHGTVAVEGINLWVIPTMNPDGDAAHTRQNAHHVDLNRNWPNNWAPLSGQYYSGPKPLSEPETQAVHRLLVRLRPRYVVSLHQPLDGVDSTAGSGPAYRAFRAALSRNLRLPVKNFQCWSVCHGSMSGWYQTHHIGVAVETVEFGWHPAHSYLVGTARRGIIAALHGHFGPLAPHDPAYRVSVSGGADRVVFRGFARDPDDLAAQLWYRVYESGRLLAVRRAVIAPTSHGIYAALTAAPGRHRYCTEIQNVGAGSRNPRTCATVTVTG